MSQRQTMQLVRGSPGGISEHRGFLIDSITRLAKDDVTADLLFICRYKESQILNIQGRYWVTFLIVGGGSKRTKIQDQIPLNNGKTRYFFKILIYSFIQSLKNSRSDPDPFTHKMDPDSDP